MGGSSLAPKCRSSRGESGIGIYRGTQSLKGSFGVTRRDDVHRGSQNVGVILGAAANGPRAPLWISHHIRFPGVCLWTPSEEEHTGSSFILSVVISTLDVQLPSQPRCLRHGTVSPAAFVLQSELPTSQEIPSLVFLSFWKRSPDVLSGFEVPSPRMDLPRILSSLTTFWRQQETDAQKHA